MDQILFLVFAAQAVVAAVLSVTRKNTVAAACWLVAMFFGLAGIYALMEAWFVAAIQILVYAGAIMVLFLFVIMLLDLRSTELAAHRGPHLKVAGIVLALAFLGVVIYAVRDAASRPDVIADRVSARLFLPAPPPVVSEDPTQPPKVLPAPAPQTIVLQRSVGGLDTLGPDGRAIDTSRRSAYSGAVVVDGKATAIRFVAPMKAGASPAAGWTVELGPPASTRAEPLLPATDEHGHASIAEGTQVELIVQRGGLAAYAGAGPDGSARGVGKALFEDWLLPFEIASLLLTGAIFGTVVLTKRRLA